MALEQITNHGELALARLLQEYRGKANIEALISALVSPLQGAEDVLADLLSKRSIETAEGTQLDEIGEIVGLVRPTGLEDASYRALIYAKIGLNISQGESERIISVFALATGASLVHMQELYPAGLSLFSNNQISDDLLILLWDFVQKVVGAGIRVDHFGYWADADAFAFSGNVGTAKGFGDETDATVGGQLAACYEPNLPQFSFAGDNYDITESGFGDLSDPIAGGKLQ